MTRVLRIAVDLPDLAPAQAQRLWELFEELADQIWSAYELEVFDLEAERFHAIEDRDGDGAEGAPISDATPLPPHDDDPDF